MLNIINEGVALGGVKKGSVLVWKEVLVEPRFFKPNNNMFEPYQDPTSDQVWDPFSGGRELAPEEEGDFDPREISSWLLEIHHVVFEEPVFIVVSVKEVYNFLKLPDVAEEPHVVGVRATQIITTGTRGYCTFPVRRQRLERMARKTILHLEKNEDGKWEDAGGYKYQQGFTGGKDADIKTAFRLNPDTGEIFEWGWSYAGSHPFDI